MPKERVQKILARAGLASRRKAEEWITEGLVTINGQVAKLGDQAELGKDAIKVKGKLLHTTEAPVYIAFHKPKGVISMMEDPEGRPTLKHFLDKVRIRLFPIGRLDFNSEGLILLTNDGEFAQKLQTRADIPRVYHVKIKGHPDEQILAKLQQGVRVEGRVIRPHSVRLEKELEKKSRIEVVVMGSGAVDLKTLFDRKGLLVEKMVRTAIGHLTLRGLSPGHFRYLRKSQVEALLKQPELGLRDTVAANPPLKRPTPLKKPAPRLPIITSRRNESYRSKPSSAPRGTPFGGDDRKRGPRGKRPPGSKRRAFGSRPAK